MDRLPYAVHIVTSVLLVNMTVALFGAPEWLFATLFLAGPPDVLDETRLHGRFLQPEVVEQIQQQQDAVDGQLGGILWAVSAKDGSI